MELIQGVKPDQSLLLDQIVKEVLFKLGQIRKVMLIEGVNYPEAWLKEIKETHVVASLETIDQMKGVGPGCDIWLPELTISQMMSVVQGNPQGKVAEVLFGALLRGVNVHVLREGVEILKEGIVRTPFTESFFKAETMLSQSGLRVHESMPVQSQERPLEASTVTGGQGQESVTHTGKVLTEKDLMTFSNQGVREVILPKDTLMTPSAKDFIRINPIKIDRK